MSEIADRRVLDTRPGFVGLLNRAFAVLLVLLENRRIDEDVKLAINDIGILRIAIELFADRDGIGAKSTKLRLMRLHIGARMQRLVFGWVSLEAAG